MDDIFGHTVSHAVHHAVKHESKDVYHDIFTNGHHDPHHNKHHGAHVEVFPSHEITHHNPHMEVHIDTKHHHSPHLEVKHHHDVIAPVAVNALAHTLSHVSVGVAAAVAHDVGHMMKGVSHVVGHMFEVIDNSNRIWVTLNAPSYVGGDIVAGTIEMDCLVPFVAKGVIVKLKGFERVWFQRQIQEWEGEGQNRKAVMKIKEFKENKEFFKTSITVYPHSGTVNPGHYSFPFQYQLPASLPGTYYEEGGDKHHGTAYYAKILYKAKATVDVAFRHDLKKTERLVVNEKFDQLLKPSFAENSKSFLTSSGKLHIRTWLDKNAYFPGETVICKLKANNTSVKPTRKIHIRVAHHLELKAHGEHFQHTHVVHEQTYAGFDPCFLGTRWMPFHIPVNLRPSSLQGHHVKSMYAFQIECDIPGAIDLSNIMDCRLLAPQYLYSAVPPQPANAPLPPDVSTRPPWQADSQANKCPKCSTEFSLFKRRHHCRHCHKVFCGNCTKQKAAIKKFKYKEPVRVCDECVPTASAGGQKYQSTKQIYQQWQQQTMPQI